MTYGWGILFALPGTVLFAYDLYKSLAKLGTLREWHHGYLGLAGCAVALPVGFVVPILGFPLWAVSFLVLLDDCVQHYEQTHGHPDYQSPLHSLYANLYARWPALRAVGRLLDRLCGKKAA